ncbi:hypothetical protein ACQ4LE_002876 [Meloidogyne hapla]
MVAMPSNLFWWRTLVVLCFVVSIMSIILILFSGIYWPLIFVCIPIGTGFGICGKCGNTSPIIVQNY